MLLQLTTDYEGNQIRNYRGTIYSIPKDCFLFMKQHPDTNLF